MQSKFKFILRTPDAELVNMDVDSVRLTTEVGEMMLLPHHASLSATVTYSPVIISSGTHEEEYLAYRGVLSFYNAKNEALLLVQRADLKGMVDYDGLKTYLKLVQDYLESGKDLSEIHMRFLEGEKVALVQQLDEEGR